MADEPTIQCKLNCVKTIKSIKKYVLHFRLTLCDKFLHVPFKICLFF
uniref:Uncharacterized protein n=1 Tax=Ciona intestinalis TaxID=7719 RepID=H2Y0G8_CIOIN